MASIADLLSEHKDKVAELRAELGSDFPPTASTKYELKYDDLFLLRYILSAKGKDMPKCAESVRTGLKWRADNEEVVLCARKLGTLEGPMFEKIKPLMAAQLHKTTLRGEPLYIIRSGMTNPKALMALLTHKQVLDYLMTGKEEAFALCDAQTRRTGKLVKLTSINDMNRASMGMERKFFKALGDSSTIAENVYPQLAGPQVMINCPKAFYALFTIVSKFFSKGLVEKIKICPARGTDTGAGDMAKCPFMKSIDCSVIPTFLGGTCDCAGGCVNHFPNSQKGPSLALGSDGLKTLVVSARNVQETVLDVEAGQVVEYDVQIAEYGVYFSVVLRSGVGKDVKEKVLLARAKVGEGTGRITGQVVVELDKSMSLRPGARADLVLLFDNTHSKLRSKTVKFGLTRLELSLDAASTPEPESAGAMPVVYYTNEGKAREGPFTLLALAGLVAQGTVGARATLWSAGVAQLAVSSIVDVDEAMECDGDDEALEELAEALGAALRKLGADC